ncbi:Phosphate ABC transporter substrate-binding protein [Gammaproteobacteria bacterium]
MRFSLFFLVCAFALTSTTTGAEVVVVVSAKSPATTMDKQTVQDIFLGKQTAFPNGSPAIPLDLPGPSPLQQMFYTKVIEKKISQAWDYWAYQSVYGKARPPQAISDPSTMKNLVASNPNAIGYIDSSTLDNSVRVVYAP